MLINMKKAFLLNNHEKRDNQFHLKGRVLSDIMIKDFLSYQDGDVEKIYSQTYTGITFFN